MAIEGEVAAGLTTHEATTTAIHGVGAGTLVGTTLAQTLTNKTLTSPTINGTIDTTGLTMPAFTLGGNVTLNGKTHDAGAGYLTIATTLSQGGLKINCTTDAANGVLIRLDTISANPADNDYVAEIYSYGRDDAGTPIPYAQMGYKIEDVRAASQAGKFEMKLRSSGGGNVVMTLSSLGVLAVDATGTGAPAQVDLFDKYDDALVLRQGLQQNNRELLVDIGVLTKKDTGSGYMVNLQPMLRLLAGGVYQTRQMLEDTREELLTRLAKMEAKWQSG